MKIQIVYVRLEMQIYDSPGSEMGIYKKAIDVDILGKDIEHWKVADFNLPMTLNLYENQNGSYTTLFNWYPENPQWWITGFNPE